MITRRLVPSAVSILLLVSLFAWSSAATGSAAPYAAIPNGPLYTHISGAQTTAPTGRIVIKFTDESALVVAGGHLDPASSHAQRVTDLLETKAQAFRLQRHFSRTTAELEAERLFAERRVGRPLPDLNRYAHLDPVRSVNFAELMETLEALLADPAVETAFLEPAAVPAALGFDAFRGTFDPGIPLTGPPSDRTPDFTDLQGYLDPAPHGVDAEGAWDIPGGRGQTVQVLDIEGAWLWEHEDLPDPFFTAGGVVEDLGWRNHGTAVVGEIRGTANGYGVSGISHEVQIGGVSIAELWVAEAINTAAANLELGDIFLIELHAPGPNATGSGQFGYVCMEYWQDNFDAIRIATACGRICCEAAGNGEQDLDDPVYQGLFDRNVRDSGAIICGASNGSDLGPAWYTNYGSRVDLHGWGYSVVTCGYGDLQGGDETEWYTEFFAGTSSATPIVVGSVACLQGMVKDAFGICLGAKLARDILVDTGTPQTGSQHIGPRPNLTAAWSVAQNGVGAVYGVITDVSTGLPVQDALIIAQETGAFTLSAVDGNYYLPFLVGTYALDYDSFFYEPTSELVSVTSGDSTEMNVALPPRATAEITGRVLADDAHTPLADVRVTPLDVPLPGTLTGPGGYWLLEGVPVDRTYNFLFDGLPLYGADFRDLHVEEGDTAIADFNVQLPHVAEDFELDDGDFTTTGDPIWAYGTPTAGGPTSGFSGEKCWGVGMDDNYGDNVYGCLVSPAYDFSGEEELLLSFHYWCETESGFDGANVQIWDPGISDWVTLIPLTGYPTITMSGVGYESGWSGSTAGWVGTVFDLADYISGEVTFRVQFGSDGGVNGLGFWVDDIAFDTGDVFSAVPETALEVGFGILGHAPNPLHRSARMTLTLPSSDEVSVAVFDALGRLTRTLHSGTLPAGGSELIWDGYDDHGALAASGVYFIRMEANGRSVSRRVILTR